MNKAVHPRLVELGGPDVVRKRKVAMCNDTRCNVQCTMGTPTAV